MPAAASIGLSALMDKSWIVTSSIGPERVELIADPALALAAVLDSLPASARRFDPAFAADCGAAAEAVPDSPVSARGLHRGTRRAGARAGPLRVVSGCLPTGSSAAGRRVRSASSAPTSSWAAAAPTGLGYGPGAAVGAALAYRGSGRLVLSLQGDGDLMYTPQALWTAAHHDLPLLVVVDANRTYGKDELHQTVVAKERGRPTTNVGRGIVLDGPVIDHAAMARSLGVTAEGPVETLDELEAALTRALAAVDASEPALVEVRTALD